MALERCGRLLSAFNYEFVRCVNACRRMWALPLLIRDGFNMFEMPVVNLKAEKPWEKEKHLALPES